MKKSNNGWKAFFWLLWLIVLFVFAYFKRYISEDWLYNTDLLLDQFAYLY